MHCLYVNDIHIGDSLVLKYNGCSAEVKLFLHECAAGLSLHTPFVDDMPDC